MHFEDLGRKPENSEWSAGNIRRGGDGGAAAARGLSEKSKSPGSGMIDDPELRSFEL